MKQLYSTGIVLSVLFMLSLPQNSLAQCMCSAGVPATPMAQTITIAQTKASTLIFNFNQFDPSIGNLSCVTLNDTLVGTSLSGALNTGPDSTAFQFLLSLTNKVTGPGITVAHPFTRVYGYDTLAEYGDPADTITYGPENIINFPTGAASTGANGSYLGTGTVPFMYSINGGMIATDGGTNYTASVSTWIGGTLTLTYYWCAPIPLASAITDFTAYKTNGQVALQWLSPNDANNITYEIQVSTDGNNFVPAGIVPAGSAPTGTVAQYQYQYNPPSADMGEVYFRIKRTDAAGNVFYSNLQVIDLKAGDQPPGIQVYPNPVTDKVNLRFDANQTGSFLLELISTTGQVIQRRQVNLDGVNFTNLPLDGHQTKGIYFLRAGKWVETSSILPKYW